MLGPYSENEHQRLFSARRETTVKSPTAHSPRLTTTKRHDAQVAELTGLLRQSASGDRLDPWPADIRILVQREKIEHRTQLLLFEQINVYRY